MSLKFSHEPVAYITLVLAIGVVVKDILLHEPLTQAILEPVVIAIGGVIARQSVTPNRKLNAKD
jgi:hypothetical protein